VVLGQTTPIRDDVWSTTRGEQTGHTRPYSRRDRARMRARHRLHGPKLRLSYRPCLPNGQWIRSYVLRSARLAVVEHFTNTPLTVLDAAGKLGKILIGMNKALGEIPLTIKLRTGVKEGRNTAHKLMPRIDAEWNVAAMTVSPPNSFLPH